MLKALIIEDQEFIRRFLSRILSKEFTLDVDVAENGEIGWNKLKLSKPDFIFLDILMPVMNGLEFLKNLRKSEEYKDIPVTVISANSQKDLVKEFIDLGVTDFILKPIRYDFTKKRLEKIFEKYELKLNFINE